MALLVIEKLYTPKQAAEILQIHERTLLLWLQQGRLRGVKLSEGKRGHWRIQESDLEAFLKERIKGGKDKSK